MTQTKLESLQLQLVDLQIEARVLRSHTLNHSLDSNY